MSVGVILPAFNEAERIGTVLEAIPHEVLGHRLLVVVVHDGSDVGTSAVARGCGVDVLEQPVNMGKGCALRAGMDELRRIGVDAVVWMDSDGQHRPEDLPQLVGPVLEAQTDMVVGSRYLVACASKAPMNRRLVRKATIVAIHRLTGARITDPFSGFRCFSPRAADAIQLKGDCYESELEATLSILRAGFTSVEVPIPRVYGPCTSKMGHGGAIRGRLRVIRGYARTLAAAATAEREPVHG